MEPIILASSSARRQEYFRMLGLPFSIANMEIDESVSKQTDPVILTAKLAVKKAEKAIEMMKDRLPKWICAADTVVSIGNRIFGKPTDREDAARMLKTFSGKKHKAVTSVALFNKKNDKIDCRTAVCSVTFAALTDNEIEWYLNSYEWQGAAGAYKIQGLASCFITQITGSPSTVVGLPLHEFYAMLRDNGYPYGA